MNTKSISAIVIIAAMVAVIPAFMVPANAQLFNTNNNASQTSSQSNTATATGGAGGVGIFGGSANGGSASVDQENEASQQAAQSGAFGTSSNTFNSTE